MPNKKKKESKEYRDSQGNVHEYEKKEQYAGEGDGSEESSTDDRSEMDL